MDTIVGKGNHGAIVTITERSTGMLLMRKLNKGKIELFHATRVVLPKDIVNLRLLIEFTVWHPVNISLKKLNYGRIILNCLKLFPYIGKLLYFCLLNNKSL